MILRKDSKNKISELFHSEIKYLPKYEKPSLTRFTTRQPVYSENVLNSTLQEKYRSIVGKILY